MLLIATTVAFPTSAALAADYWWIDGGTTWNTTDANWSLGGTGSAVAWPNGNQASFHGAAGGTITVGTVSVAGMYFDAGSYTFNSGTITLTNALINAGGTAGTDTATINSTIAGTVGLTKQNSYAGTLVLGGLNTYSGATTIGKGTVSINTIANSGSACSLGQGGIVGAGAILFTGTAGMVLKYTGTTASTDRGFTVSSNCNIDVANGQTLTMGAVSLSNGNVTVGLSSGGGTGTLVLGNVTLGAAKNINTASGNAECNNFSLGTFSTIFDTANTGTGTTVKGILSGSGNVTKTGNGASGYLTLSGPNTYTGQTIIQRGIVNVTSLNNLGGGGLTPLTSSSLGAPTGGNGTIKMGSTTQSNLATLMYGGSGETTDRAVDLAGTTAGAALDQSGTGLLKFIGNFTASGAGAKTLTLQGSTAGSGEIAGAIVDNSGTNTTALTKSGTGAWALSGANTFSGKTAIQGGVLGVTSLNSVTNPLTSSSLGRPTTTSLGTIDLGSTTATGQLTYAGTGETTDRVINLAGTLGGGILDQSGSGLLKFTSAFTAGGAGSKTLTLQGSTAGSGEIAGAIVNNSGTNTTALTKSGTGTWTLSGANTYSGKTSIRGGVLSVTSLNSVTIPQASSSLGRPTTTSLGTIDLGSTTATGQLTYAGTGETTDRVINLAGTLGGGILDQSGSGLFKFTSAFTAGGTGSKTLTLQGSTAGSGEIAGAIVDSSGGATALAKSGTGTWTLSGSNSYTGGTTISQGTLALGINGAFAASPTIVLGAGATLDVTSKTSGGGLMLAANQELKGDGTALGNFTLGNGSILSPGSAGVGTLSFEGNLTLSATSIFRFELGASSGAGTTYDRIRMLSTFGGIFDVGQGAVNFSNFLVTPLAGFGPGTYVLFDGGFATTPVGTLGSSLTGTIADYDAAISLENASVLLTITANVPEPMPGVLFVCASLIASTLERFRRISRPSPKAPTD